jgi:16S rRNA G1207 methylase RsmC
MTTTYDREVLVEVIIYHWRADIGGCGCGWGVLGASYAEHVADVYEESVTARAGEVQA